MNNGNHHKPLAELETPSSALDIEQIWFVLREKAWLIALFGLVGIFAGLAYIHRTPLTYFAQAVILVDPEPIRVVNFSEMQDVKDPISEQMGQTLLAVFKSRNFAQQVVQHNKLLKNPDFIPPRPDGKPHGEDDAIGALIGMSRVAIRQGTRFIDVGVMHSNPRMAKELADMLANTFIMQTIQQREATTTLANDYLMQQADKAANRLTESAKKMQDYVKKNNAVSLVGDQDTVISELKSKNAELSAAHSERIKLESDDEEIQKHLNDPAALLAISSVANHPSIVETRHLIGELQARIEVLKLRYTEEHPKMKILRTQLADANRLLDQNLMKIPPVIHSAREAAVAKEEKFKAAVDAQEVLAMKLNDQHIEYDVISRNMQTDQALYEGILTRLKQAKVATGIDSTNVHIFEPAMVPVEPLQARKSRTLGISLVGGLLLGIALAMGLHFMDSSVKTVDQAEQILGLTVLAAVPRQSQNRLKESGLSLVREPGSPVAEAFRSLRTALYLVGRNKGRKIVLFTSALAGEGKTFCSINYATALAQQGLRTLLIDADLRSPMIGNVLLEKKKYTGLTELLSGKVSLDETIHPSGIENLSLLPSGELLPNPAELLAGSDFGNILNQISERFDRVVIDTAPVTAVSDTLLLVEHAQAVCLVARAGKTPRKWSLRAIKLLDEAGAAPSGVVLNQVPMRMIGAYSYYPGSYGEPGVYGSNGARKPSRETKEPAVVDVHPRL